MASEFGRGVWDLLSDLFNFVKRSGVLAPFQTTVGFCIVLFAITVWRDQLLKSTYISCACFWLLVVLFFITLLVGVWFAYKNPLYLLSEAHQKAMRRMEIAEKGKSPSDTPQDEPDAEESKEAH